SGSSRVQGLNRQSAIGKAHSLPRVVPTSFPTLTLVLPREAQPGLVEDFSLSLSRDDCVDNDRCPDFTRQYCERTRCRQADPVDPDQRSTAQSFGNSPHPTPPSFPNTFSVSFATELVFH